MLLPFTITTRSTTISICGNGPMAGDEGYFGFGDETLTNEPCSM